MKRHDALIPLTHDHHHALAAAKRLGRAAAAGGSDRATGARAFLDFFDADTIGHFREEEEVIFPLAIDAAEAEPVLSRLLLEHVRIHALVTRLRAEVAADQVTSDTPSEIASLLQEHIRQEEKVLFPLIETIAADNLALLELAPRNRVPASAVDPETQSGSSGAESPWSRPNSTPLVITDDPKRSVKSSIAASRLGAHLPSNGSAS